MTSKEVSIHPTVKKKKAATFIDDNRKMCSGEDYASRNKEGVQQRSGVQTTQK